MIVLTIFILILLDGVLCFHSYIVSSRHPYIQLVTHHHTTHQRDESDSRTYLSRTHNSGRRYHRGRCRIWQNSLLNCDTLDDIPSSVIVVPLLWLYSLGCTIIYMSILLISQVHPLAWNNLITQSNELSKCSLAIVISKVRFICINHKVLT